MKPRKKSDLLTADHVRILAASARGEKPRPEDWARRSLLRRLGYTEPGRAADGRGCDRLTPAGREILRLLQTKTPGENQP
jgi:hypothetical protein